MVEHRTFPNDERLAFEAIEDYRRQRQLSRARKGEFGEFHKEHLLEWIAANEARLKKIVIANGTLPEAVDEVVAKYIEMVRSAPDRGPFDDVNAYIILRGVTERVRSAGKAIGLPQGGDVTFGASSELGLNASQLAIFDTDSSIIELSQSFIPFCNIVARLLAKTFAHSPQGEGFQVSFDAKTALQRVRADRSLARGWFRVFCAYALTGWMPYWELVTMANPGEMATRILMLEAIELFVVGHEFGHHALGHGVVRGSVPNSRVRETELEADIYASLISLEAGHNSVPQNYLAMSRAGAIAILHALEWVRRARHLIAFGNCNFPPSNEYPDLGERLAAVAKQDVAFPAAREAFEDTRQCIASLFLGLWEIFEPGLSNLHKDGIRPEEGKELGWLP